MPYRDLAKRRESANRSERRRRAANPEKFRAAKRKRYAANRKRIIAQSKAYYAANRDKVLARKHKDYTENPEKYREYARKWRAANPDKMRAVRQRRRLKQTYGLTLEQGLELRSRPCGVCGGKSTDIDHDHTTGKVRGGLCGLCNTGLGMFKDDPERLLAARKYLLHHRKKAA